MTSGVSAFGTFLIWNYNKVLEITSISGPSQSRDAIELTSHDSSNSFREFVAGIIDGGEISIEGNFITGDALGQIKFHTDLQDGEKRSCFIVMPMAVGGAWSFEAIASGFESTYPFDDKIGVSGTLKITGQPVLLTTQSTGMSALIGDEYDDATPGAELSILPVRAVGTYAYTCTVSDSLQDGVKLTVTAATHTIYTYGIKLAAGSGTETLAVIPLVGDDAQEAATVTNILILVHETDAAVTKAPRLYTLSVTRPAAAA